MKNHTITLKLRTVKFCLALCLLVQTIFVFAKDENTLVKISGSFRPERGTELDSLIGASYLPAFIDTYMVLAPTRPGARYTQTTISLLANTDLPIPHDREYTVVLEGNYRKIGPTGGNTLSPDKKFTLTINYNPVTGTSYKQRDAITIRDAIYTTVRAKLTVTGYTISNDSDALFRVEIHTEGDVVYPPPPSTELAPLAAPTFNTTKFDEVAQNMQWNWTVKEWAEYYELEYLHVDDYKADGGRRARETLKYNFRQDAVRVRVLTNSYEMPLVFEQGYVMARVRAVGMKGTSFNIPVYSEWSTTLEAGTIPASGNNVYEVTPAKAHEADRLNWIYNSTFNESGMRSEGVAYADGTTRMRQQVAASPQENKLLVSETFYDNQGRSAITTLPAPIKPAASSLTTSPTYDVNSTPGSSSGAGSFTLPKGIFTSPALLGNYSTLISPDYLAESGTATSLGINPAAFGNLHDNPYHFEELDYLNIFRYRTERARIGYVPHFNVNTEGQNFKRTDYDKEVTGCDESSVIFGTQSGAGNYYSTENRETSRWQAYVPNAEGYPYAQVKYNNNGTGKITQSSMPGAAHKIGGGKTQRFFYGTPSQSELDKFFGLEAGRSSFYKKTMMLDENGQAHVSIHNIKGNLVLSALAGDKPENLEAITGAERMNVTLDLIEENNVLNVSDNSWSSTKRLILPTGTDVTLAYQTASPDYADRYCTSTSFCYDCVYDLAITITDNCGQQVYHQDTSIGKLADINHCTDFQVRLGSTIRFNPGSYLITKKLTVNAAAVEAYVNNYRDNFTCRTDTLRFLPDVDLACNPPCNNCNLTTASHVIRRRSDGSNPSFYYNKRAAGNNVGCVLACTQTGLSECAMAYQTMLSEVSPGGQYAEYRDTMTRRIDYPLGFVNPAFFPLSVLNDDNQLPFLGATWRNPLYNYQTKTGEDAYIVIGTDGLPAHRSPVAEIRTVEGRQYVLVKYLNDVNDFIRLWEPQWAEALVMFHPEYEYYWWCTQNEESYRFDSLMLATEKYNDAASRGLANLSTDVFFGVSSSRRTDMETRLANFTSSSGTILTAAQTAIASVHCGNPNFNPEQFAACYTGKTLYGTAGAEDKEWTLYKGFYKKTKLRVLAADRNRTITGAGGFNNRSIGGTRDVAANSLYAGKRRVFREEDDIMDALDLDIAGEEPTVEEMEALKNRVQRDRFMDCNVCPTGVDVSTLLNAMVYEKKLTAPSLTLPGVSPLNITKNFVNSFSNNTALQYNWTRETDPNPNVLHFKISAAGVAQCDLYLQKSKPHVKWDSLVLFDCLTVTGDLSFTMRAIDKYDSTDIVQCRSTCFRMRGYTFPAVCTPTAARREMKTFLQYLFEANRYKQTSFTILTSRTHAPYFGDTLRSKHPGATSWQWSFAGFATSANTSFNARLNIYTGSTALMAAPTACDFSFRVLTPGFSFDSLGFVIGVYKPSGNVSTSPYEADVMVRSKGGRIFYIRMSSCYQLFDCNANRLPREGMCSTAPPRHVLVEDDCESSLHIYARREAERDFIARRERAVEAMRTAYIRHCIQSVDENFTLRYADGLYMATLYYYDQSGKLIKTVPPKGVRALSDDGVIACAAFRNRTSTTTVLPPAHVLTTTYKYSSFGSLSEKTSPDEGTTKYCYDFAGRSIMVRNADQSAKSKASYVLYDKANRIIENGRTDFAGTWQTFRKYAEYVPLLAGKAEITSTTYDDVAPTFSSYFSSGQKRLRNRPSVVKYQNTGGPDSYVSAYSYDALGNVTCMVQQYPQLGLSAANAVKKTEYTYDKLSGQITRVLYQQGQPDQFIQWISYDANKRVTQVQTSTSLYTPESLRETDAKFYYYLHGPLARTELGTEKIQGIDYAYTIQGWLKGINSYRTGEGSVDMGQDGTEDGSYNHGFFASDVTAELLNYFPNDYEKVGEGAPAFYPAEATALNTGFSKPLYNGNIQNSMMSVSHADFGTQKTFAQGYSYDQANRLRQSKNSFSNDGNFGAYSNDWSMTVDYDLNGNINTLTRTNGTAQLIDNLTYNYPNSTLNNQLGHIDDLGTSGAADLRDQNGENYAYDAIGRLTKDVSAEIGVDGIQYNNQSKVVAVNKRDGNITYSYDAFGRRISKTVNGSTEWYVNDAMGNPLAIYNINGSEVRWKETGIYAGKRIGVYKPNVVLAPREMLRDTFTRGLKSYELSNHIGDVLAVISDRRKRVSAEAISADVQAAHNYYPFGMVMPGRKFGDSTYRYGFQGMESEDDVRGENNNYTTEFRQYDPRVGRWMSADPKADKYADLSPYNAFLNNPVNVTDPKGDEPPQNEKLQTIQNIERAGRFSFGVQVSVAVERDGVESVVTYRVGNPLPEGITMGDYRGSATTSNLLHDLWVESSDDRSEEIIHAEQTSALVMQWRSQVAQVVSDLADVAITSLDELLENPPSSLSERSIAQLTGLRHSLQAGAYLYQLQGAAENTATLVDGMANFDALSRAESSGQMTADRLFAARVRAMDQIFSGLAGLVSASPIDLGMVGELLSTGNLLQIMARNIFHSIYELNDEELQEEMTERYAPGVRYLYR